MEWQPIETAPKDGTPMYVLWDLRDSGDGWMRGVAACFDDVDWMDGPMPCCEPDFWLPLDALPRPPSEGETP